MATDTGAPVDQVTAWLHEGIAAARAGQRERARELLVKVVARDEQNEQAWLWLSGVVDDLEDRRECLENVLRIDPGNAAARRGLDWVQQQMQQAEEQAASVEPAASPPAAVPEPPVVQRTRTPISPAAALLREDFISQRPVSEPSADAWNAVAPSTASVSDDPAQGGSSTAGQPAVSPVPTRDEFSDEYGCPYCAAETEPDDRRCWSCGKSLWVVFRKQEKRSRLLWVLLTMQLSVALHTSAPVLALALGSTIMQELVAGFGVSPLVLYWLVLPSLLSTTLAAGLYFRWKPVYYLLFADAGIGLLLAVFFLFSGIDFFFAGSSILLIVVAVVRFGIILQLGDDFEQDRKRILLRTDPGLKRGVEYLMRADFYNKQKMWAMVIVHRRAAVGQLPNHPDCHMGLAMAYMRLKRFDRAARTLAQAKQLSPNDPHIAELEILLDEMRAASPA